MNSHSPTPRARNTRRLMALSAAAVVILLALAATRPAGNAAPAGKEPAAAPFAPAAATAASATPPAAPTKATPAPVAELPSLPLTAAPPATQPAAAEPAEVAPLREAGFTLRTEFRGGSMLFVGVGGEIDGVVNPDLVVAPGTLVQAVLVNGDGIVHDLYFPDFEAQSAKVGRKGKSDEISFTVPADQAAAVYVYYCTLPGHREAGQEGRLIVDPGA